MYVRCKESTGSSGDLPPSHAVEVVLLGPQASQESVSHKATSTRTTIICPKARQRLATGCARHTATFKLLQQRHTPADQIRYAQVMHACLQRATAGPLGLPYQQSTRPRGRCGCQSHNPLANLVLNKGNRDDPHLLSQQACDLTEVDRAALGSTDSHEGHAVGREGLALTTRDAALDHLTGQRVHHTCKHSPKGFGQQWFGHFALSQKVLLLSARCLLVVDTVRNNSRTMFHTRSVQ